MSGVSQGWVLAKLRKVLANMGKRLKGWSRKSIVRNCRRRGPKERTKKCSRKSAKKLMKTNAESVL